MTTRHDAPVLRLVAWVQGIYFALTGIWPILEIDSFMAVTGPKRDLWLVRTVGALILVVGVVLIAAARSGRIGGEVALLAVGCALALAAVDVVYVANDTISPIYLLDALAELVLVAGWLVGLRTAARSGVARGRPVV